MTIGRTVDGIVMMKLLMKFVKKWRAVSTPL